MPLPRSAASTAAPALFSAMCGWTATRCRPSARRRPIGKAPEFALISLVLADANMTRKVSRGAPAHRSCRGRPGEAQTNFRTSPRRHTDDRLNLGSGARRTATSIPSSTRSTTRFSSSTRARAPGCLARNRSTIGMTCMRPNSSGAVTRSQPASGGFVLPLPFQIGQLGENAAVGDEPRSPPSVAASCRALR